MHSLGPWQLEAPLGRGGMGAVHRARHLQTGRVAAVKTVAVVTPAAMRGIRSEIRALTGLEHPGVVSILDSGVTAGRPWYAMELVEGDSLRSWGFTRTTAPSTFDVETTEDDVPLSVAPDPTPMLTRSIPEILDLACALCVPLAFLHGRGLVHRDLKPENVVVRPDGVPVLVDFGITTGWDPDAARDRLDLEARGGTRGYIAPEVRLGQPLDARADLYALGCMLYELLTGWLPVGIVGPPPAPSRVHPLPPLLDELVLALMADRRDDRPGYAEDVARALVALGASLPDYVSPPAAPYLYRPSLAGRDEVLGQLDDQLDEAVAGRGGLVVVAGESGVGKSRVVAEMLTRARYEGIPVQVGRCSEGGPPFEPFVGVIQALVDRCMADETAQATHFGAHGPVLAPYFSALQPLVAGQPEPERLSPEANTRRLNAALDGVLGSIGEGLVVLGVDDVQWADDATRAWLDEASQRLSQTSVLVVCTFREEEGATLPDGAIRVPLGRLAPDEVAGMVRGMLGRPDVPAGLVERVVALSEGNPFFVAETLRAAVDEALLVREDGAWKLAGELPDRPLGHTRAMHELVGRRLAAVPEDLRQTVNVAAVIGRDVPLDLLDELVQDVDVAPLLARHIFVTAGTGEVRFSHGQLRQGAYNRLNDERRRDLHARVADAWARRPASLDTISQVAWHRSRAGQVARARARFGEAAQIARDVYAFKEAARLARAGLAIEHEDGAVSVQLWCVLGDALRNLLEIDAATDAFERAVGVQADVDAHSRALYELADHYWTTSRMDEALTLVDRMAALAERASPEWQARGLLIGCVLRGDRGDLEGALDNALQSRAAFERAGNQVGVANALSIGASVLAEMGDNDRALTQYDEALRLFEAHGSTRGVGIVLGNIGSTLADLWRLDEARDALERALALHRQTENPRSEGITLADLGEVCLRQDQLEQARAYLEQALEVLQAVGDTRFESIARKRSAQCWRRQGDLERAREEVTIAMSHLEEINDPLELGMALCERGHLALAFDEDARPWLAAAREAAGDTLHGELGRAIEGLEAALE